MISMSRISLMISKSVHTYEITTVVAIQVAAQLPSRPGSNEEIADAELVRSYNVLAHEVEIPPPSALLGPAVY